MKLFFHRFLFITLVVSSLEVSALPFNDDMVNNQIKTGQTARVKPAGVIERGAADSRIEKKEDAANFTNPHKGDAASVARGTRLFRVNCYPCHGDIAANPYKPGPVLMGAPDLTMKPYSDRTDGSMYGTIHFGGMALMPAYGAKLSPSEHWDIISYVRKVQESKGSH